MKVDVRDLIDRINLKDPISIAGLVSLVVATVLFAVTARALVSSAGQHKALQAEQAAVQSAIARVQQAQEAKPEKLRQDIAEA